MAESIILSLRTPDRITEMETGSKFHQRGQW
jgi:hypothetical protein